MRALVVACAVACALSIGACLYPEYAVKQDGGTAGTAGSGTGGTGGTSGGAPGIGGAVAGAGRGGSTTATAGTSGGGGTSGAAGSISGVAGTGGGGAGRGGTTGTAGGPAGTGGGIAGRGGTTGAAGTGGGSAGRGGTTGTAGGPAGTGGSSAGRGGTTGTGGSVAGRGGTTGAAGTGGGIAGRGGTTGAAGAGGATAAPNWVPSIAVVYQFDLSQGYIGSEAHGDETLHLEEDTNDSLLPTSEPIAIEGKSGGLPGPLSAPAYFRSPSGAPLPGVFRTEPNTSFTTGGWFRIGATLNNELQYLISDDGPGAYQGGFIFYLDQRMGSFASRAAFAYCRIGISDAGYDYNEAETPKNIGADSAAGNRWVHLVCRYDAGSNQLSIFVAGLPEVRQPATHQIKSGPGPFMLGCDVTFCAFIGNMDEVFYATTALPDEDIIRIYACGIDGSRCRCSGSNYFTCGFVPASSCGSLPACNAPTP